MFLVILPDAGAISTSAEFLFLFLLQNIDCGYSLDRLREAVLTCTHNLCFEQKYQNFSAENFQFLKLIKSLFITWACFRNGV